MKELSLLQINEFNVDVTFRFWDEVLIGPKHTWFKLLNVVLLVGYEGGECFIRDRILSEKVGLGNTTITAFKHGI